MLRKAATVSTPVMEIQVKYQIRISQPKLLFFVGLPHVTTFFSYFPMNGPELGAGIDPGMAFYQFASSILDKTIFKPTTNPNYSPDGEDGLNVRPIVYQIIVEKQSLCEVLQISLFRDPSVEKPCIVNCVI